MDDYDCFEEPDLSPFISEAPRKVKPERKKPHTRNADGITISQTTRLKMSPERSKVSLSEIEDEMRDKPKAVEEEHKNKWYLDSAYVDNLEHRMETCFRVTSPEPTFVDVYKCYIENREHPIKCRNLVNIMKKQIDERQERFTEKARKAKPDEAEKKKEK